MRQTVGAAAEMFSTSIVTGRDVPKVISYFPAFYLSIMIDKDFWLPGISAPAIFLKNKNHVYVFQKN
jgi:hypothetical protein